MQGDIGNPIEEKLTFYRTELDSILFELESTMKFSTPESLKDKLLKLTKQFDTMIHEDALFSMKALQKKEESFTNAVNELTKLEKENEELRRQLSDGGERRGGGNSAVTNMLLEQTQYHH